MHRRPRLIHAFICGPICICCAALVWAPSLMAETQTIDQRVERLEKTIEGLQDELIKARGIGTTGDKGVVKSDGEDITVFTNGGGIQIKSDNGNSFKLGGRIMLDYDYFDGVFSGGSDGRSASEAEHRRTRLTAIGSARKDWRYKLTLNIEDEDETADVNTAYIEYVGFEPLSLKVGKFKEQFSLERLTSSKWGSTIERNMAYEFLEGQGQPDFGGVQVSGYHEHLHHLNWALGLFDDGNQDEHGKDNYAVTGRVTVAPHFGENHFLHLGAAYSVRDVEGVKKYGTRLGVHTADKVSAEGNDAYINDIDQFGLEAAYIRGPFSLQAEYMGASSDSGGLPDGAVGATFDPDALIAGACYADANNDGTLESSDIAACSDIEFDSYYLQATYMLTGEMRGYKPKGASFGKFKPSGTMGAWELVARYEKAEAEWDVGNIADNTRTDEFEKWVLGVNWYANQNIEFMLNYITAEVDSEISPGNDDGDAWSLRARYVF